MKKLLVILGPTATGKTDLAIDLAKRLNGELISSDSRQVYKGLDIGTGKLPGTDVEYEKKERMWLIDGVPVWMYDVVEPDVRYDVWQYIQDATAIINKINENGKLPIVVGGTGLYIKGLLEGLIEIDIPADTGLRAELELRSLNDIQQKLAELDPIQFESLNASELSNKRRLIRKIEKLQLRGELAAPSDNKGLAEHYDVLKVGLMTSRAVLYQRIDQRVLKRVNSGMIEEARSLNAGGLSFERMQELGLEYRLLVDLLMGKINSTELFITQLQFKIHQYAKRQLTWFRRDKGIHWFDIESDNYNEKVEENVLSWYNA